MRFHPEILTPKQQKVLQQIAPILTQRDCYLAGGTTVAIYLGHRRSEDFDCYTEQDFDPAMLAADLREAGIPLIVDRLAEGTILGSVSGVPVSS